MIWIDIVAAIAIGYGAFMGFRNGIVKEAAGLLGVIVGVWAGLRLAFVFANYYRDSTDLPEAWIPLIAFLTAFLIGIGAVYLLGRLTSSLINSVGIALPNKLGGLVFGAAKWAFLIGTAVTLVANSGFITQDDKDASITYPVLSTFSTTVQDYTIGLVPAATNVLDDVETYFVGLDSTRRAEKGLLPREAAPADSSASETANP